MRLQSHVIVLVYLLAQPLVLPVDFVRAHLQISLDCSPSFYYANALFPLVQFLAHLPETVRSFGSNDGSSFC